MTGAKSVKSEAAAKVVRSALELSNALSEAAKAGVIVDIGVDEIRFAHGQTIKQVRAYVLSRIEK